MKKAEEYVNDFWGEAPIGDIVSHYDICEVIKRVQADAIKETCQACAENADADYTFTGNRDENSDIEVYVIKSSILEVADKLIKELE